MFKLTLPTFFTDFFNSQSNTKHNQQKDSNNFHKEAIFFSLVYYVDFKTLFLLRKVKHFLFLLTTLSQVPPLTTIYPHLMFLALGFSNIPEFPEFTVTQTFSE